MVVPLLPIQITRVPGAYAARVRLWRCDRSGNRLAEVPLRTPVRGTVSFNQDAPIKQTVALEVTDPASLSPLRDYVEPEVTLVSPDGTSRTRSYGVHLVTPPKVRTTAGLAAGTIEAYDLTWHLLKSQVGEVGFDVGEDTGASARAVGLGAGFPAGQLVLPDTGVLLAAPFAPNPGTSRMQVMTDLLCAGNWYAPWMDAASRIAAAGWKDLQEVTPDATWRAPTIVPPFDEDPDWSRIRNAVTVRNVAPDREPIWATARITNPAHPLFHDPSDSNAGIGYEIAGDPVDDPNLPDEAAAQARAESLLSEASTYHRKVKVKTIVDLDAGPHDVIELVGLTGRFATYNGRWWRRTWTTRFTGLVATTDSELWRAEEWR